MRSQRLLLIFATIAVTGCIHHATGPTTAATSNATHAAYVPQIVYAGTPAYDCRIASFKITPDSARKLADQPGPACVIDDWYLFTRMYKYKRIDLAGTYVNGLTGESQHRNSDLSLLGDNSTLGSLKQFPSDMPHSVSDARVCR